MQEGQGTIEDSAQGLGKRGGTVNVCLGQNLFLSVQKPLRQNYSNISGHDPCRNPSGKVFSLYCIVIFPNPQMECFFTICREYQDWGGCRGRRNPGRRSRGSRRSSGGGGEGEGGRSEIWMIQHNFFKSHRLAIVSLKSRSLKSTFPLFFLCVTFTFSLLWFWHLNWYLYQLRFVYHLKRLRLQRKLVE